LPFPICCIAWLFSLRTWCPWPPPPPPTFPLCCFCCPLPSPPCPCCPPCCCGGGAESCLNWGWGEFDFLFKLLFLRSTFTQTVRSASIHLKRTPLVLGGRRALDASLAERRVEREWRSLGEEYGESCCGGVVEPPTEETRGGGGGGTDPCRAPGTGGRNKKWWGGLGWFVKIIFGSDYRTVAKYDPIAS
jgi:hypothetical protein